MTFERVQELQVHVVKALRDSASREEAEAFINALPDMSGALLLVLALHDAVKAGVDQALAKHL